MISVTDTDSGRGDLAEKIMATAASEECIGAVAAIVMRFGAENVFVLSKCGRRVQQATVVMLSSPIRGGPGNFFDRTGLHPHHVLFCNERKGGDPPAEADMELLPPLEGRPFVEGPRVAPGSVGRAVGGTLKWHPLSFHVGTHLLKLWKGRCRRTDSAAPRLL